jgi:hypothetical protein
MNKADYCMYLKNVIIKDSPDDFTIAEQFRHGLTDDEVRAGIKAFRTFLYDLYDKIAQTSTEKPEIDINEIAAFLYMMGVQGHLETEPRRGMVVLGSDMLIKTKRKSQPHMVMKKISAKRIAEVIRLLSEMGFCFDAIDYSKPVKLAEAGTIHVTNECDGDVIVGLKLIALAQMNTDTDWDRIQNGFMRCHFSPLASDVPINYDMRMANFADTQPPQIRDWLLELDKLLVDNGCSPNAEIIEYATVIYNSGKKMVCRIDLKISECIITVNTTKAKNLDAVAQVLPADFMTALEEDGCECGRQCKKGAYRIEHNGVEYLSCNNPPHKPGGFNVSLGSSENRRIMRRWVEMELGI